MSEKVRSRPGFSYAFNVALFGLPFLLIAGIIRMSLPLPPASGMRAKFEYFEEHADEYDVVFFGSSRVLTSIIPGVFEEELAKRGVTLRAFNFGVPGLLSFETDYYLERILDLKPARLRWLVCDLSEWKLDPRYLIATDRLVAWRTPERTWALLEVEWRRDLPLGNKIGDTLGHLGLLGRRVSNAGEIQKLIAQELGVRTVDPGYTLEQIAAGQGYQALEEETGNEGAEKARERFLGTRIEYEEKIHGLEEKREREQELLPYNLPPLRRRLALFRNRDVELIQVIFASEEPQAQLYLLARAERTPRVWAFNKPSEFPELYTVDHRYDERHLNRTGAELFTRIFAERFAAHLAGSGRGEGEQ